MLQDIQIKSKRFDDPNLEMITSFFRTEFPDLAGGNTESLVAIITDKMIGSRNYRLAGRPTPESEVAIRDVIRVALESGKPIPVLVVCGPKKPQMGESIDIAELSALRILACVQRQVQEFHPAGLDIRLRMEDATGSYLEGTAPEMVQTMDKYITDMTTLVRILGYNFITVVRESSVVNPAVFRKESHYLFPHFFDYLKESTIAPVEQWTNLDTYNMLQGLGWSGTIPPEMRDYYHHRYTLLFPAMTELERLEAIARYFSSTLARRRLKATADNPEWNGKFIQINFAPPTAGDDMKRTATRLFYRTVPMSHTKKHLPFWRAKGYLKLNGQARISLATWNEPLDLTPFEVELSRGTDTVTIRADYMIEEEHG